LSAIDNSFFHSNTKIKWFVLSFSLLICMGSIFYTNRIVTELKNDEKVQVELLAKALQFSMNEDAPLEINFISEEIIKKNNSIPIIWVTNDSSYQYRNVQLNDKWSEPQKQKALKRELEEMKKVYRPIEMTYKNQNGTIEHFGYIYYKNSSLLSQIIAYPYIQLSVIAIFAFITYLAFNYSRVAEQNRVWVGLAKETAHQLGTPISSLMAWIEVIREDPEMREKGVVDELEKDIQKLRIVTERFSSIGSTPALKKENVVTLIHNVVNYLRPRVSAKIRMDVFTLSDNIAVMAHAPLFEWVIENLCKNAVDAMGNTGTIAIKILRGSEGKVFIDVSDTGKGIPRSKIETVFRPGFTTKKRGWGLGLTLAKRIIETYHSGKIFVKYSEENQGTTFRITLDAA
jgi:signal transduction histidine kinase